MELLQIDASYATALSVLAKDIYREYYLHLWLPGGADWYMDEFAYPEEKLKAELADPLNLHYMAMEDKKAAGYLKLRLSFPGEANAMELERIYLHRHAAGKGAGKQMMLFTEGTARKYDKRSIYLKAMDTSDALAFYAHMGYTLSGKLTLPFPNMKPGYRGMVILRKEITG